MEKHRQLLRKTQELFLVKPNLKLVELNFGEQTPKPMCAQIEKAIGLFATFKPETPFSPKWGLDRALAAHKNCK